MWRVVFSVFLMLHGLVHLLYFGQSRRFFELQPKLVWPDGSWVFSRSFGDETARLLAAISLVLATVGFVVGGVSTIAGLPWWRPAVIGSALLSIIIFLLFWNGQMQQLPEQGIVAILINLVILAAVLIFRWPG